jgi:hypothetical protein
VRNLIAGQPRSATPLGVMRDGVVDGFADGWRARIGLDSVGAGAAGEQLGVKGVEYCVVSCYSRDLAAGRDEWCRPCAGTRPSRRAAAGSGRRATVRVGTRPRWSCWEPRSCAAPGRRAARFWLIGRFAWSHSRSGTRQRRSRVQEPAATVVDFYVRREELDFRDVTRQRGV